MATTIQSYIRTNADAVLGASGLLVRGGDRGLCLLHGRLEAKRPLHIPIAKCVAIKWANGYK